MSAKTHTLQANGLDKEDVTTAVGDHGTTRTKLTRRLLAERRAVLRFPTDLYGLCHEDAGETGIDWLAVVRNISQGGINLIMARAFPPGTLLTVQLKRPNEDVRHAATARIVFTHPDTHGWSHGCVLLEPLSELQLTRLLR